MLVSDSTSDDKPARPGSAAEAGPPLPQEQEKQQHITSDSSEDGNNADIEAEPDHGQEQSKGLDSEKTVDGPPLSRHASSFAHSTAVVPRAERRGLLGRFAVIPEIECSYEYKKGTKWMITAIVALAGAAAPMGSGIFMR